MTHIGVVSYLNARPLVEGLLDSVGLRLSFDVPSRLAERLFAGEFAAALLPVVDVLRSRGRCEILSDSCIACDGETMTVRVFSQVPPHRVQMIRADADSHTSVALARVLWRELYGIDVQMRPLAGGVENAHQHEAVLLIGDKVVDPRRGSFAYETDLGGAWRQHTGLPFVFAVWAQPPGGAGEDGGRLAAMLSESRDRGVERAERIAEEQAARHGFSTAAAVRYLTRCLRFRLDERTIRGAEVFARHCRELGIVPSDGVMTWPGARAIGAPAEGRVR
ncbi:MAG: menaquinone biosynthesis protein [Planctomycetia bacterium]|nr:MAG: menaquinone biosynthesis protein [Planctomycetia bacterium]